MDILFLIGRVVVALYFLYNGQSHLRKLKAMSQYAAFMKVPAPTLAVVVTGLMLLFGGATLALGALAPWGALVLILFLVPVALKMHRFWGLQDPMQAGNQQAHFLKNIALAAFNLVIIYLYTLPDTDVAFSLMP